MFSIPSVTPVSRRRVNSGVCPYFIQFIGGDSSLRLHGVSIEFP